MNFDKLNAFCINKNVTLVAVSKTKPSSAILELYNKGQRIFGENKLKEIIEKNPSLPADIQWHFIGHLQTNKVKQLLPFTSLIHSVDSRKLVDEIQSEGAKINKNISILLQVRIAKEETKFGLELESLTSIMDEYNQLKFPNIKIKGLMGMSTFTDNEKIIRSEFQSLKRIFDHNLASTFDKDQFSILSMGMSSDYEIAIEEGANMIRIGSLLFGER